MCCLIALQLCQVISYFGEPGVRAFAVLMLRAAIKLS